MQIPIFKVTPLHLTAINGYTDAAEALLIKGAKIDAVDTSKMTAFHFPANCGKLLVARKLVNHIINRIKDKTILNLKHENGFTPLHFAVQEATLDFVRFLIDSGSEVNARNTNNATPLHIAAQEGHLHIIQELFTNNSNTNPIEINIKTSKGNTPLHSAAKEGLITTATLLLKNGADINAKNHEDFIPLDTAIIAKKFEFALFLLNFYAEKKRLVDEKILLNIKKIVSNTLNSGKAGDYTNTLAQILVGIEKLLMPKNMLMSNGSQQNVTSSDLSAIQSNHSISNNNNSK